MGSSRYHFSIFGYCYPEFENIFMNISVKTKIFSKIFLGVDLGPRYYPFMKKPELKNLMLLSFSISFIYPLSFLDLQPFILPPF